MEKELRNTRAKIKRVTRRMDNVHLEKASREVLADKLWSLIIMEKELIRLRRK